MRPGLYAFAVAAAFLGATIYIGLVEQPARLKLNSRAMVQEWKLGNRRSTQEGRASRTRRAGGAEHAAGFGSGRASRLDVPCDQRLSGAEDELIEGNPDQTTDAELEDAAIPILDRLYSRDLAAVIARYDELKPRLATTDVSYAAHAATAGASRAARALHRREGDGRAEGGVAGSSPARRHSSLRVSLKRVPAPPVTRDPQPESLARTVVSIAWISLTRERSP